MYCHCTQILVYFSGKGNTILCWNKPSHSVQCSQRFSRRPVNVIFTWCNLSKSSTSSSMGSRRPPLACCCLLFWLAVSFFSDCADVKYWVQPLFRYCKSINTCHFRFNWNASGWSLSYWLEVGLLSKEKNERWKNERCFRDTSFTWRLDGEICDYFSVKLDVYKWNCRLLSCSFLMWIWLKRWPHFRQGCNCTTPDLPENHQA